ncbi:MAG: hypothetical protein IT372_08495, partial [Polyangiaceae bacterium]|nr:hypothetical protein [Polyangiaceae bacterium]
MASPQRSTAQETPEQPGSPAEGGARPVVRIVEEAAGEAAQAIISSDEVGAEIVDEAGEPHVTFAQLRAYGNSLVARLALLVIVLVLLAGVYARAFTVLVELPSTAGEQSIPGTMVLTIGAAAITLACALPVLLMYCMKVLVVGSLNARARYRMPLRRAGGDAEEARLFDEASRIWAHEVRQFDQRSSRLSQHVNFYGFFGSAALSATVMLGLRHLVGQGGGAEARGAVALALLAASVGAFVSEVSRMIVRAANRDASARMFAWASKRFLLILLTTAVLCGLVVIGKPSAALPGGTASWLLLGAGVAFLGDRASQAVGERVAGVLGVGQIKHPEPSDLAGLDG